MAGRFFYNQDTRPVNAVILYDKCYASGGHTLRRGVSGTSAFATSIHVIRYLAN